MIQTVAEFLEQLREKEAAILAQHDVKHAPTIGRMYEGLTKDLLDIVFPQGLGLSVTSGFVVDSEEGRSKQVDCMITCAPGNGIPHTDNEEVHIDNVVAVVEVKKNLYSSDLRAGYLNLASLRALATDGSSRSIPLLKSSFQSITRHAYPEDEGQLQNQSDEIQMIFHALAVDLMYPARIIFGYNGFAAENALRESFANFIEESETNPPTNGFRPASLPSLICCGSHMLLKANGMPFCAPMQDDGYWPIYASLTGNPLEVLLEIIWTRLSYEGRVSEGFFEGSELAMGVHRFLDVRPEKVPTGWGWRYRYIGELPKELEGQQVAARWEPAIIDPIQHVIIVEAEHKGHIDLSDPSILRYLTENGYTPERMVETLNELGLAARVGNQLRLLTKECATVMMPDGRIAAGENSSGQLANWALEENKKNS